MAQNNNIIYGNTGIINTQNSCYMNSAIQAISHLYPLTSYLFRNKNEIIQTLIKNSNKIFKNNDMFSLEINNLIPIDLKKKIHDPNYDSITLTQEEIIIILNNSMTYQLIRLLEGMWTKNCTIKPTSFKRIFSRIRNKFFVDFVENDAEEAYSSIIQQVQEELSENKEIKFETKKSVKDFLSFIKIINDKYKSTNDPVEKEKYKKEYSRIKQIMKNESLIVKSYKTIEKYYKNNYSKITEIFLGFIQSSLSCPNEKCKYSSNTFEPFLHLSLPIPQNICNPGKHITIYDCIDEFCKTEILDEKNLWSCDGCKDKVKGIKKIYIWEIPMILVIQIKRFNKSYNRTMKDSRCIMYPMDDLDVSNIISPIQYDTNKCYKYSLQCVINHYGELTGGHYFTYCKDENSKRWFSFNDDLIMEINPMSVVTPNAYMLFYIKSDMIN